MQATGPPDPIFRKERHDPVDQYGNLGTIAQKKLDTAAMDSDEKYVTVSLLFEGSEDSDIVILRRLPDAPLDAAPMPSIITDPPACAIDGWQCPTSNKTTTSGIRPNSLYPSA
jgi:hypothetical protein